MNIKLAILVLVVAFGCKQKPESKDVTQLRESLPLIATPVKFNSDIRVKYKTVELPDNELIKKISQRSAFSLIGKLFETENNITILGYSFTTVGTPIVITFDREGNEISSHAIFETAESAAGRHSSNRVTIFPNRQIMFTDSTVVTKSDRSGVSIREDSLILIRKTYLITDKGTVEKLE